MDAIKRRNAIKSQTFKLQVSEYFYQKANEILLAETPDPDELAFSKAVFARRVQEEDMTRIVAYNSVIGSAIDSGIDIPDSDVAYSVLTESRFTMLAQIYKAAGLV